MAKGKPMKGITSIERNGATYWYARVDGDRVYCGKDAEGRKLAEAARSKYVGKRYENREQGAGVKTKKAEFRTIKELCDWYMLLPTTQERRNYRHRICNASHLLGYFGGMTLAAVDGDDQDRYRERRGVEGASDGTVDNEIALLSAMYHLALKRRKILPEMMPGQFIKKNLTNPRRILTEGEFEKLLSETLDDDFKDFLVCGYETAMRVSEIRELRAGQIHLDQVMIVEGRKEVVDYVDLGIFDTKTRTRRTVPVSPRLKEILAQRLAGLGPDDHVFTVEGAPFTEWAVRKRFRDSCKRAEITHGDKAVNDKGERAGIVFHCLRHTRTTRWVEAGFSDEIIRRATGHVSLDAYKQYVKLHPWAVMRLVNGGVHTNGIKSSRQRGNG